MLHITKCKYIFAALVLLFIKAGTCLASESETFIWLRLSFHQELHLCFQASDLFLQLLVLRLQLMFALAELLDFGVMRSLLRLAGSQCDV
jgi:hypothetical protein